MQPIRRSVASCLLGRKAASDESLVQQWPTPTFSTTEEEQHKTSELLWQSKAVTCCFTPSQPLRLYQGECGRDYGSKHNSFKRRVRKQGSSLAPERRHTNATTKPVVRRLWSISPGLRVRTLKTPPQTWLRLSLTRQCRT